MHGLRADPTAAGVLFAATGDGVLRTVDGGASWIDLATGLEAPGARFAYDLALAGRRLIAATGSGLYALDLGAALDADGDGVPNLLDTCPFYATPEQVDTDGNGRGDACECGDQNGDGALSVSDIVAINEAVFGGQPASPLCDANGDGACNVVDIVAVNAAIFGGETFCARHPRPAPGRLGTRADGPCRPDSDLGESSWGPRVGREP